MGLGGALTLAWIAVLRMGYGVHLEKPALSVHGDC